MTGRWRLALAGFAAAAALLAEPAAAADRRFAVASFERLRVEGPLDVRVTIGGPPRAGAASTDRQLLDRLVIEPRGDTLAVRLAGVTPPGMQAAPVVVTLATPRLAAATLMTAGSLSIDAMRASRGEIAAPAGGQVVVTRADIDDVTILIAGQGMMTVSGKAHRARLVSSDGGSIDAAALTVDDLVVSHAGTGEARAQARYTAQVVASGAGHVTVAGRPQCVVRGAAATSVTCGERRR